MALNPREKRTIWIGGALALAVLFYLFGLDPLRRAFGGVGGDDARARFLQARIELNQKEALEKSIRSLESRLNVQVVNLPPSEQKQAFMKKVEELGRRARVDIKSFTPSDRSSRTRGASQAQGRAAYSLQLLTGQQGLVTFMEGMQTLGPPVVFNSLDVKANPNASDKLTVNLEFHTYLFKPHRAVAAAPEKKAPPTKTGAPAAEDAVTSGVKTDETTSATAPTTATTATSAASTSATAATTVTAPSALTTATTTTTIEDK